MKQLRIGMWETNSSSLHQLAICTDPPTEIERYRGLAITVSAPDYWSHFRDHRYVTDLDLRFGTLEDRIASLIASWNSGSTIYDPIKMREWLDDGESNDWDDAARMVPVAEYLKRVAGVTLTVDWASFDDINSNLNVGGFIHYHCNDDESMGRYLFNTHYLAIRPDPDDGEGGDDEDVRTMIDEYRHSYSISEVPVH